MTSLSLALLFIAFGSLLSGLAEVIHNFDLGLMIPLVIIGLLLGWGLAKWPLPGWLGTLIASSIGIEALVVRVGLLGAPLLALPKTLLALAWATWRWPWNGPPNMAEFIQVFIQLRDSLTTLLTRLNDWAIALIGGTTAFDPVVTTLLWGLDIWAVAVWAGWGVRRRTNALLALAPATVLLLTVLAHSRINPDALIPFLGAMLLLTAVVSQHARERYWDRTKVSSSPEMRLDLAMAVIPLTIGIVLIAILSASLLFVPFNNFIKTTIWRETLPNNSLVADSLGLERRTKASGPLETVRWGGLPRNHLLGSGPELSEQVVMTIQTNDPIPASPDEAVPRYYWRSLTYDHYNGRGWQTRQSQKLDYQANETPDQTESVQQRRLRQTVQGTEYFNGLLHVAGELVTVDQDFTIDWRGPNDIFGATVEMATYQAESRLPTLNEVALRRAEANYPEAIQDRYLALPDTLPSRVLALARDLTATAPTPYDRAKAIESYLRTFPYNLDLPPPPPDQDIADYFLFDLQQGYCDYYATSMVVLARAAGLPARMAIGYIHGTYNRDNHHYIVTEAEAHSWVEIYFPEYGWVNFEPTGGRPAIERQGDNSPTAATTPENSQENSWGFSELNRTLPMVFQGNGTGAILLRWLSLLGGIVLTILGIIFGWHQIDSWWLHRLSPPATVAVLQRRLYRHGRWLDSPPVISNTPYEFARSLIDRVNLLATRSYRAKILTPAGQEVLNLTNLYIQTLYSPHHFTATNQAEAIRLWQQLRRRLWVAWFIVISKKLR